MKTLLLKFEDYVIDPHVLEVLKSKGFTVLRMDEVNYRIVKAEEVNQILQGQLVPQEKYVILEKGDWTIIPLENLIAYLHGRGIYTGITVTDPREAAIYLNVLEKGVDALVLEDSRILEATMASLLRNSEKLQFKEFKIISIEDSGPGDRVCIDTITMLNQKEGVFVGSFAKNMLLVLSENAKNEFINTRPFRVNSGSIHQYIYAGNGKTNYLSELIAGSKITVFDADGNGRLTVVGRSKIEFRPLLHIRFIDGPMEGSIFLQNAETVRLMSNKGDPIPINELKEGDLVRGISLEGGRHYGMKVDEKLIEI